jgi:hypothetical protein
MIDYFLRPGEYIVYERSRRLIKLPVIDEANRFSRLGMYEAVRFLDLPQ